MAKLYRPDKATIHWGERDGEDDPRFLHLDGDDHDRAVTAAADAIDAAFRAANGGDQDKSLCGGCVAAVVNNLFLEMLRRGDPTLGQAGGWALTMKRNMEKIVHGAASEAYRDGGDRTGDKVYRDKPKPRKRKKT